MSTISYIKKNKSIDSNKGEFISIPYSIQHFVLFSRWWWLCAKLSHALYRTGEVLMKKYGTAWGEPIVCALVFKEHHVHGENINFFEKWNLQKQKQKLVCKNVRKTKHN